MLRGLWRRIAAASRILFLPGDHTPVTRKDLTRFHQEWAEWQITFTEVLEKLNAWYARQSKREKRYLARMQTDDSSVEGTPASAVNSLHAHKLRKMQLRRRVAGAEASEPPPPAPPDDIEEAP